MTKENTKEIPKKWVRCSIGEICFLTYGKGLKASQLSKVGYDVYGANGIIGKFKDYLFEEPKVIISCRGAASGAIHLTEPKSFITNNSIIFHFNESYIDKEYFIYALKNEDLKSVITGSAQPQITIESLKKLDILLAPIAEQKQIVAQLNELIARSVKIAGREEHLNELEERALKSFLYNEGKLFTPIKLGEYCNERNLRAGDNWLEKKLIGVSNENGITQLRVGDKKEFSNYKVVQTRDFVYNPMRVDIGSIAIWDKEDIALTSPDYIVFYIEHTLSPLLLLKFLKSPEGLAEIRNNTRGSVRSRLYFNNLKNINFPFNGVEGQIEAQFVFENFLRLKNEAKALITKMEVLIRESFTKAFTGRLTKFDPSEESASALLQRIKDEKQMAAFKIYRLDNKLKMENKNESAKPILQMLTETQEPMVARNVWKTSKYEGDIDGFYEELRKTVANGIGWKLTEVDSDVPKSVLFLQTQENEN